jgi:large subunit ribosomal protein L4
MALAKTISTKIDVLTSKGSKQGTLSLNPEIFAARINKRLLDLVLKAYAANQREGNANTKTRKEVRGGGKKPWKQKGTGRARVGSTRSPIWRGGGTVFGPHTREYRIFLPRTMRLEALRSALSLRLKEESLTVLEDLKVASHKTKEFAGIVKNLKFEDQRALYVTDSPSEDLKRASQNLQNARVIDPRDVTAYDVLRRRRLVISKSALPIFDQRFNGSAEVAPAAPKAKRSELAGVK